MPRRAIVLGVTTPPPLRRLPLSPSNEFATWVATKEDLDLDPSYQRGSVWGPQRQRNLWRSLMQGVFTGAIVISMRENSTPVVVDGRQRIEAVRAFFDGNLDLPSYWFDDASLLVPRAADTTVRITDLTPRGVSTLSRSTFAVARIFDITEQDEQDLFDLINFGGVPQGDTDPNPA